MSRFGTVIKGVYAAAGFVLPFPPRGKHFARALLGDGWRRPWSGSHGTRPPDGAMYIPALEQIEIDEALPPDAQNWLTFREVCRSIAVGRGDELSQADLERFARELALTLATIEWHDLQNQPAAKTARQFGLPVWVVIDRLADIAEQTRISAA